MPTLHGEVSLTIAHHRLHRQSLVLFVAQLCDQLFALLFQLLQLFCQLFASHGVGRRVKAALVVAEIALQLRHLRRQLRVFHRQ